MILVRTMLQDFYFTSFTHFLFALVRGFNGTSPALAISAATPPQEAASLPHRSASSKKSWAVEALFNVTFKPIIPHQKPIAACLCSADFCFFHNSTPNYVQKAFIGFDTLIGYAHISKVGVGYRPV